jgi:AmmeMemoRadiSam system protein A
MIIPEMDLSPAHQHTLLDIARASIRQALRGAADQIVPASSDPLLNMPAGCFVSLHDQASHRLRGCVGRLDAKSPLIQCVYEMSAGVLADPRFRSNPVTTPELPRLTLELSILSPMQPAPTPLDFDPQRDGIYLTCQARSGTFLPQVARQTGWTREQLLSRLCSEKLGLPPNAWQDPSAKLLTYQALVIGPVPFQEIRQENPATGGFGSGNIFRI